jgi:hypothetical protein
MLDGMLNRPQTCSSKESFHLSCISMGLYLAGALTFSVYDVTPSVVAATLFSINELEEALSLTKKGPDSVVDTATGYGLDGRGVSIRVPVGARFFSSPHRPDRLWGRPSLLSNGYRGIFPRG